MLLNCWTIANDMRRWIRRTTTATMALIHDHAFKLILPNELSLNIVPIWMNILTKKVCSMVYIFSFSWRLLSQRGDRVLRRRPWGKEITSTDLEKLPPELLIEIMAKMNLSLCSMVNIFPCSWLDLMTHPLFLINQYSRDRPRPSVSFFVKDLLSPDEISLVQKDVSLDKFVSIKLKLDLTMMKVPYLGDAVNPCHGLMCFQKCHGQKDLYYLSNPLITADLVRLPDPEHEIYGAVPFFTGLGYSPNTNQYKLLRISGRNEDDLHLIVGVYTIGTSGWRRIEDDAPFQILLASRYLGNERRPGMPVAFNGVLHWSHTSDDIHYQVFCFDVEREQVGWFPLPNFAGEEGTERIGVLNGCFIMWKYKKNCTAKYCQIWVLKDYSIKDSWFKLGEYYIGSAERVEEILDVDEDGKKVLMLQDFCRVCYSFEAKTNRRLKNLNHKIGIAGGTRVESFVPNLLVSPRHMQQLDH